MQRILKLFAGCVLFFSLILFSPVASAATIYVTTDQSTIQAAIDSALEGDSVIVENGTYTGEGNKNLDFRGKAITVQSENGPENCIIDCEGDGIGFSIKNGEGTDSVISGFTITNGGSYYAGGIECKNSSSPTITNCNIIGNSSIGFGGGISCVSSSPTITECKIEQNLASINGGGIFCQNSSATITNCIIKQNTSSGSGGGIYCRDFSNISMVNCLIVDNSGNGGVYCYLSSPTILNCTISRNVASISGGVACIEQSSPIITNSIIWDNIAEEIYQDSSSEPVVSYCDVQGDYMGEGNFYGDPLFVDAENNDYHLSIGSPCIYAARASDSPAIDVEGNPRPQGYGYDIGAYEATGYYQMRPIIESFTANTSESYVPFEVNFNCVANDPDGEIVKYGIDYGDGSELENNATGIFSHVYTSVGTAYVTCYVTDDSSVEVNSIPIAIVRHGELRVPAEYATIQAAIDAASDGDTVLVSDGPYTGEGNKNLDFKGKAITVQSENGPDTTIIDCENNGRGFYFHSEEGNDSILSGFTILNGYADPSGGAFSISSSSPSIENCFIKNNSAAMYGGGVMCYDSSPIFFNCTVSDNNAGLWGGGIFIGESSTPSIINSRIVGNSAEYRGGGIYSVNSSPNIVSSFISNNFLTGDTPTTEGGGGIFLADTGWSSYPILTNCILAENIANYGGAIRIGSSYATYLTIRNCTISSNEAKTSGGGIYGINSDTDVLNSIVWKNINDEIVGSSDANVMYCTIKNGWPGEGNLDLYPVFVDSADSNFDIRNCSPCIGAGTAEGAPDADINGNPRPNPPGSNPDMGAYENSLDDPEPPSLEILNIFGMEIGNKWTYEGIYQDEPVLVEREITALDQSTFSVPTYVFEIKENGSVIGTEWYEDTGSQVNLWGTTVEEDGTYYTLYFSEGLKAAWYPMEVSDHAFSSAVTEILDYEINISLTVDVVNKTTIALAFDTIEAYEVHYQLHIWSADPELTLDVTESFSWWMTPYLGVVKDQYKENVTIELTSFAIGSGSVVYPGDTDGDELSDYDEFFMYNTHWLIADTESDGMPDGWEVDHNLNPLANDAGEDADGDHFSNLMEYQAETDPNDSNSHPPRPLPWLMLLLED